MLTGDLVRVAVKGTDLHPRYVKPDSQALREVAAAIVATFHQAVEGQWKRGQLDEALDELIGQRRDHKVLRGLAKLCLDRSELATEATLPPAELRALVFRTARRVGPLALEPGWLHRPTADDVLAAVAEELDTSPEAVADGLYADLAREQRLLRCTVPDAEWLLHRYNVALVQAVVLKATQLTVALAEPSQGRLRQLLRHVRFHQLVHEARFDGGDLVLRLDGPASLFRQSTRYGLNLARFVPALLLQDGAWRLDAEVLWTKARHRKRLQITSEHGLRSHLADHGAYEPREHQWFRERFEAAVDSGKTAWSLAPGRRVFALGGRGAWLPDFTLTAPDGRVAHLEIAGFWRPRTLQRRVAQLREGGPPGWLLGVSKRLAGAKGRVDLDAVSDRIVPFAEVLPVKKVLSICERVGTIEAGRDEETP